MSSADQDADTDLRGTLELSYLPAALLWRELRSQPGGLRFCRQRTTGKYVHDFYCRDARLAIEIEPSASTRQKESRDSSREEWLARAGIATIRVSPAQLVDGARVAVSKIVTQARDRLPRHHPRAPASSMPGSQPAEG